MAEMFFEKSNDITITAPAAVSGRKFTVKKISSSNVITIDTPGAETIDGLLTQTIVIENESITMISDGTNWMII